LHLLFLSCVLGFFRLSLHSLYGLDGSGFLFARLLRERVAKPLAFAFSVLPSLPVILRVAFAFCPPVIG